MLFKQISWRVALSLLVIKPQVKAFPEWYFLIASLRINSDMCIRDSADSANWFLNRNRISSCFIWTCLFSVFVHEENWIRLSKSANVGPLPGCMLLALSSYWLINQTRLAKPETYLTLALASHSLLSDTKCLTTGVPMSRCQLSNSPE